MTQLLVTRSHLRREMDRLFDDVWGLPAAPSLERDWSPACDIEENEDHYLMSFEMPGVAKDQIKIECQNDQITISGERNRETKTKQASGWYSERQFGKFSRTFTLPSGVNAERVEANYQDGILRLYLPKSELAKPRQIKIGTGSVNGFFGKLLGSTTKEAKSEHVA